MLSRTSLTLIVESIGKRRKSVIQLTPPTAKIPDARKVADPFRADGAGGDVLEEVEEDFEELELSASE